MSQLKNSPVTNLIGGYLIFLSSLGLLSSWFFPNYFHGQWSHIVYVFMAGIVFLGGLSDEMAVDIYGFFKRKLGGGSKQ